ncbi:MAG: hypothetical protein ACLSCQ_06315 [Evtepia gabavorous]
MEKRRPRSPAQPDLRRRDPQQQLKARAGQKEEGRGLTLPGQGPFLGFQAVPGQGDQFPLQSQAEGILPQAGEGEGVPGGQAVAHHPGCGEFSRQMGQGTGRQQGPAGGGSGWDLDKVGGDHHQIGPPRRGGGQGPPPLGRQVGA